MHLLNVSSLKRNPEWHTDMTKEHTMINPAEWDADRYDRISAPQVVWGERVTRPPTIAWR